MSTVNWIAKNPKSTFINYANQSSMKESDFFELMKLLIHNSPSYDQKLEVLLLAKGFFSAEQSAQILSIFSGPKDKLKCMMILEPKLLTITCQEARNILACFTIHEDRLEALQLVKRALSDSNTSEGLDNILACFIYEDHKIIALKYLNSVLPQKGIKIAAGGHQGYSPLGQLNTTAPPNNNHFYGPSIQQVQNFPNHRLKDQQLNKLSDSIQQPSIYSTNNPNYHIKSETNFSTRSEYLNPYKIV